MRHALTILLPALAAVLFSVPANAVTTATLTVDNTVRTLTGTGFLSEQLLPIGASLGPGQSADFTISYSLSVQDDGQPATLVQGATGCISIFPTPCGPTYSGFEYAKAFLIVAQDDPRSVHNPALVLEGL